MPINDAETMRDDYDFSQGTRGAVIPHPGKTRITIWVDTDVLDSFRSQARREGRGYQTAMNDALRQYTQEDRRSLPELVCATVREEVGKLVQEVKTWAGGQDMSTHRAAQSEQKRSGVSHHVHAKPRTLIPKKKAAFKSTSKSTRPKRRQVRKTPGLTPTSTK